MQGNISQSKYVEITSGVGGANAAAEKEAIARVITGHSKAPSDTVLEFEGIDAVGAYFGASGAEYAAAAKYFGFISKQMRKPRKISFYRSTLSGLAPFIYATQKAAALGAFKNVSDGALSFSMDGQSYEVSGLDFTTAPDYASVAAIIQAGIRGNEAGGELWTQAEVAFNATDGAFSFTGGKTGEAALVAPSAPQAGTDMAPLLGWNAASAPVLSQGKQAQSMSEMLDKTLNLSNNFASLVFLTDLTAAQITEAAQYTHLKNMQFQLLQRVTADEYAEVQAAVAGFDGVCLVYDAFEENSWPHILPAAVAASADYNAASGAPGYDFQKDNTTAPSVTDDAMYEKLSGMNINFIGRTQQAGQGISFYQPGLMQGSVTDQGVYMNEVWLKDKVSAACLNTQMALNKWPAGEDGLTIFDNITQPIRSLAKTNGVVTPGKTLTESQKAYITMLSGDDKAWQQVQIQGDYMYRKIVSQTVNGTTKYVLQYTYIYSKGDQIRKIEGAHILI